MLRVFLILVLIAILAAAAWAAWAIYAPVQPHGAAFVLLRPGWSSSHIAHKLQDVGVIRSARAFLLLHYLSGRTLKAGEYKFDSAATVRQVHDRIARGDIYVHTVVIPEGFNEHDIANVVQAAGLGSAQDFLRAANGNVVLIRDLDPQATSLEGYLFPDTYHFTRTQSMTDIVAEMVHRFRQKAQQIGLSSDVHRVVTMASIVEKETAAPEERPIIASVYYNRLRQNMALAADPTVIYAALLAGQYTGAIRESDLQYDSPYNTYRHTGLPPGPIANPGLASLQAAMRPADTDYLYFVSDNNGHHRFARTLEEHARNVAAYRRALAGSR